MKGLLVEVARLRQDEDIGGVTRLIREQIRRPRGLSRGDRLVLARAARWARVPELALSLLVRQVRGAGAARSTEAERAEYAIVLTAIGRTGEALPLFDTVDLVHNQEAFEGWVLAKFRRWEWAATIPLIEKRLSQPFAERKKELSTRYFLGRALLHGLEETGAARKLFDELIPQFDDDQSFRVEAIHAQAYQYMIAGRPAEAKKCIQPLEAFMRENPDHILAIGQREVHAFADIYADPRSAAARRAVEKVAAEWSDRKRWYRLRYCDYHAGAATGRREYWLKLYFGTPLEAARERFRLQILKTGPVPATYSWRPSGGGPERELLDLQTGRDSKGDQRLRAGQTPLRTVHALAADLYEPPNLAVLHERVFPGEIFNPDSAPGRVHHAVWRTRQALEKTGLEMEILEDGAEYFLKPPDGLALQIEVVGPTQEMSHASLIRSRWPTGSFSASQFGAALQSPLRTASRWLKDLIESNEIEQLGKGPATRYRLKSRQ